MQSKDSTRNASPTGEIRSISDQLGSASISGPASPKRLKSFHAEHAIDVILLFFVEFVFSDCFFRMLQKIILAIRFRLLSLTYVQVPAPRKSLRFWEATLLS